MRFYAANSWILIVVPVLRIHCLRMLVVLPLLACDAGSASPIDSSGPSDTADSAAADTPWQVVAADMPGAFLSVWGLGADDVYVVGGDGGNGPEAWHFDGAAWTAIEGLSPDGLWWISGDATRVWMAGISGRVFRLDRATGAVESWVLDGAKTFFGIWGPGDGTAWAVGGDPDVPAAAATVWHFDGAVWTEMDLPASLAASFALYKVWGTAPDDVWTVGAGGVSGHWEGSAWTAVATGVDVNLYTVNAGYAVGGASGGAILRIGESGTAWIDESPEFAVQIFGVHGGDVPVAVGARGSVWHRDASAWFADPHAQPTFQDLHSTWVDPDGGVWAAGGHFASVPLIQGTLVYLGGASIPPLAAVQ